MTGTEDEAAAALPEVASGIAGCMPCGVMPP